MRTPRPIVAPTATRGSEDTADAAHRPRSRRVICPALTPSRNNCLGHDLGPAFAELLV